MTQPYGDIVEAITNARFHPVRVREGYDMHEVDDLLDQVVAALGAGQPVAPVLDDARLSHVRLREGYDIAEVDHFLAGLRQSIGIPAQKSAQDAADSSGPDSPGAPRPPIPHQRRIVGRLLGRD